VNTRAHSCAAKCLRQAVVTEMLRRRVLHMLVSKFDEAAVPVLLLKGAGLAYTVYTAPYLRPARDIDLFVRRESLQAAEDLLTAIGYQRVMEPDTELAGMQRHYIGRDTYFIDLHWCVSNRHVFAETFSFSDAWKAAELVLPLGGSARTLGKRDAFLLACIHRIAHHNDDLDPIWLWDIHLLATSLTTSDARWFPALREATSGSLLRVPLELARQRLRTTIEPRLFTGLGRDVYSGTAVPFIKQNVRLVDLLLSDLETI
jgi:hypothetical protein